MQEVWKRNIPAGIVVFFVALPLCLGIALAQGAPLLSGLISGIIGGVVVGFLSGSQISVSGPAAGLTVVVISAIAQLGGFSAFALAVFLSGVIQIIFSLLRGGVVSKFIPGSVIKGMLAAIGIIIILKQLPYLVGYDPLFIDDIEFQQQDGFNTFTALWAMLRGVNWTVVLISLISLAVILIWDKLVAVRKKYLATIPGSLLAVFAGVSITFLAGSSPWLQALDKTHLVQLPTDLGFKDFTAHFISMDFSLLWKSKALWTVALTIAIIGSIETLLSLEAADKIDPLRRVANKTRELWAQGTGNMLSGLLGGLPITAVIVRTVTNVNSGGTHRIAAIWHGALLFIAVFGIPKILNHIPLAALAMVLAIVGYKLSSLKIFKEQWHAGKEQFIPFAATVLAVVFTDILSGVVIGCAFALAFVVIDNYRKGFFSLTEENHTTLHLAHDISFLHRPGLSEELRNIPDNTVVTIAAESPGDLSYDIAEIIKEFRESAALRGIELRENEIPYLPSKTPHSGKNFAAYEKLIHGNRNWVKKSLSENRNYFSKLAQGQSPEILWIGCADSRVPPNEITGTKPGEIFIHRNVANLVVHTDLNMLSVLQYAIEVLHVKHVIVCGHYECGGIKAAMGNSDLGLANNWLRHIKEVYASRATDLDKIVDPKERERLLVELNVAEQVRNLAKTSIIQQAWKKRQVEVHGWVIELSTGYIKELPIKLGGPKDLDSVFRYAL